MQAHVRAHTHTHKIQGTSNFSGPISMNKTNDTLSNYGRLVFLGVEGSLGHEQQ